MIKMVFRLLTEYFSSCEGDEMLGANNNKLANEAVTSADYELAAFSSFHASSDFDEFGMYQFSSSVFVCFNVVTHIVLRRIFAILCSCTFTSCLHWLSSHFLFTPSSLMVRESIQVLISALSN